MRVAQHAEKDDAEKFVKTWLDHLQDPEERAAEDMQRFISDFG